MIKGILMMSCLYEGVEECLVIGRLDADYDWQYLGLFILCHITRLLSKVDHHTAVLDVEGNDDKKVIH